jgi:hypothetical protein
MAKRVDTTQQEANGPEPGRIEAIALSETQMFQDGPAIMLLDQAEPDRATDSSDDLDLRVSLTLEELLPDDAGEVVLIAAEDVPIDLLSSETVTEAGIAPEHVTMGGMEVTGLHYYSFESGLTVYSPVDLLILNDPSGV